MNHDCVGEAGLWFVLFYFYTVCYDFMYVLSPAADIVLMLESLELKHASIIYTKVRAY